ncbi:MAG: DoxX family protein [Vicinamibacteria bacterium]
MTTPSATESIQARRGLHIALWVAQGILAAAFAFVGLMKVATPAAELQQQLPPSLPLALVRFIGMAELAGALGVILPAATRIEPYVTPIAAIGLLTVMVLAGSFHLSRGEPEALPLILFLGGLAAFVAWGRFRRVPLPPRA